jgi:DNA-binding transcriptional ArsR family regulator
VICAELANAQHTLAAHGDHVNAAHATCLSARCWLLRGRVGEAERVLAALDLGRASATVRAEVELAWAECHLRALRTEAAYSALGRAERAARAAHIPALLSEIAGARGRLGAPAARALRRAEERVLRPAEIEALLGETRLLLVDARELAVRAPKAQLSLARRPVLFSLLRTLAEAWPNGAPRGALILSAFSVARGNESHRARLRVEIARLRRALRGLAEINATGAGFLLTPLTASEVVVLAPLVDDEHAAVLTLLEDGEAWSSSALSVALDASQRSVQRALLSLEQAGKVRATGRARARRWLLAPNPEFAAALLLPRALGMA